MRIQGDNSCGLTNGVCEDGGLGSVPGAIVKVHDDGRIQTLCGLGTEYARRPRSYGTVRSASSTPGPLSYMYNGTVEDGTLVGLPRPPLPRPPPSPSAPPPPPPPPFNAVGTHCSSLGDFQTTYLILAGRDDIEPPTGEDVRCSDGGLGSHSYRISGRLFFICDFGGQVDKCGRRAITNTNLDGNDQSESSIESCGNLIDDGKCDDAGAKSFEDYAEEDDTVACTLGYGEDAVDCGARPIQFAAGEIAIKPPPSPPPPPVGPRRRRRRHRPSSSCRRRRRRRHRRRRRPCNRRRRRCSTPAAARATAKTQTMTAATACGQQWRARRTPRLPPTIPSPSRCSPSSSAAPPLWQSRDWGASGHATSISARRTTRGISNSTRTTQN